MAALCARSTVGSVRPAAAPRRSVVANAGKTMWLPGAQAPSWLKEDLPGYAGFDPLNFGVVPERLAWYAEAEKFNGRIAMLAVAGIVGAELHNNAVGTPIQWYEAGRAEYWLPVEAQLPLFFMFSGFVELKRYNFWKTTGKSSNFDPLKMTSAKTETNEIKNGRLAMTAFAGFAMQALVSRTNPIEGLTEHLSDPFTYNAQGYLFHTPEVLAGTF